MSAKNSGYPPRVEEILRRQTLNTLKPVSVVYDKAQREEVVIRRVGAEVMVETPAGAKEEENRAA